MSFDSFVPKDRLGHLPACGSPPYKDSRNCWRTISLFEDVITKQDPDRWPDFKPPFTLEERKKGYICAKDTWLSLRDPTGFKWAELYLNSYEHYKQLLKAPWFAEALERWQEELLILLKSEAIARIREISSCESPAQALAAAKYIAEEGWNPKRGRPSKAELKGELKRQVQVLEAEDADLERIGGLKVIKGGR